MIHHVILHRTTLFIVYKNDSTYSVYTGLIVLLSTAIDAGKKMGVDPVLTATEMEDPNIDHLSVMAYLNRFRYAKPVKSDNEKLTIQGDFDNHLTGVQVSFTLQLVSDRPPKINQVESIKIFYTKVFPIFQFLSDSF